MNKDIKPRNDKEQAHGYWEVYWSNGLPYLKCTFHNGNRIGYCEDYSLSGKLISKMFYIN